ncbi:nuclear pore complex protein NUP58 [Senna tora]|uniref:Nuclear pore complex protein NUP58 n=1 Tax=Senna tora TaxID=362788 RepID=A0A834SU63_9FABA|nr:nuclear pore complex protein NUP58 [Senna tora]
MIPNNTMSFPLFSNPQQPQQIFLFTRDKTPATYSTKWADLHPDSQRFLLQIEERILEYRDESQRLDQSSRLFDSSVSNEGSESDASHIIKELGGISTAIGRQKNLLQELTSVIKNLLRNTEVAVRSFMMLRPRFLHPSVGNASSATAPSHTPGVTVMPSLSNQPSPTSIVPVLDFFYNGVPKKPSPFLQKTISRFENNLAECRRRIEELEQLLVLDSERKTYNSGSSRLQSLPKVVTNVHDVFVNVAAKVESIHQHINSMKSVYLAEQRHRGEVNNPFVEADRRETARQEASSKRVHPTLHLPANSQPSTQVAGLFSSSGTQGALAAPHTSPLTSNSSGSGLSVFSTPSSAPSSSMPSLFPTPTTSAPVSSLFGSSSATPKTSGFKVSSGSLFGSTPSQFGNTNTAPSFGSVPGGSVFPTPSTSVSSLVGSSSATPKTSRFKVSTSSLLESSSATPKTSRFKESSSSLFGSTPSQFGNANTAPSFGSAPGGSVFPTPSASGSGLSVFSTPSSAPSSSMPSLFPTPTTSAPVSSLVGSSSATPKTSRFKVSTSSLLESSSATPKTSRFKESSSSLFGSTPSQFGNTNTAPSFGSAPGGSVFPTPSASGAATGSGASSASVDTALWVLMHLGFILPCSIPLSSSIRHFQRGTAESIILVIVD